MAKKSGTQKRIARYAAICLTALVPFSAMGCAPSIEDRANALSENLLNVCNEQVDSDCKMKDFKILGADIDKIGFDFEVRFNGLSSFSDKSVGYTSINYNVPSVYFNDINKSTEFNDVYNVFDSIVENLKPESISVSPISDIVKINDAFVKNEPALFDGFKNNRAIVFNLAEPNFDDETNTVDFDIKMLIEEERGSISANVGLGVGFDGSLGVGYGIFISPSEGTFLTTNNYKMTVDKETYEKMKKDHSLVFDYCVSVINEKDNSKIKAKRVKTVSVADSQAKMLKQLDIKNINKELISE